ncbi:MAG TPA: gluconokinase [Mucilaginibacter sp.]|nr:gluconokinase [Mucilaginibacter sp.]
MEYVLGIDIGTGSVKAVAVNLAGQSFEVCSQHYGYNAPKPGYYEQDPEQIWDAFTASIKAIINKTGAQPLAISLSSAMHSLISVDDNCRALAPMTTWADSRSVEIAKRLRASAEGMAIYTATGTPLHAMSPLCKITWMRENDPGLFAKTYKFIGIKEYIWYRLFDEFAVDHSVASGTGLFNIGQLQWHAESLAYCGITVTQLSKPVATNYTRHFDPVKISALSFLKAGTSFVIGASDGCLANLGSMANKPGIAAMTIGTSGAVRVASNKSLPNPGAMTFSYILDKDTFICGGPINNGGVALQWWLKNSFSPNLTEQDYAQLFDEIASVPAGSNGLIFLPYLTGERAPIWDSESCGNFFGIKLQHTRAHFSRAVLEGICYAMKHVLDAVQQNSEPITQINISGGFTKSKVWVQTLADITNTNLAILQADDASAVGAALLALKSLGLMSEYPESNAADLKIIKPDPQNPVVYAKHFGIYKQLYVDLRETMHRVYRMGK